MSGTVASTQVSFAPSVPGYREHFERMLALMLSIEASDLAGRKLPLEQAVESAIRHLGALKGTPSKCMVVGNGGSAGIASHQTTDMSKNAKIRSVAFTDPSLLTCLSNDFGYEQVFAKAIEIHGAPGDILVAISSSGRSQNILNAVESARKFGNYVITLAGFDRNAPLLKVGDLNFYVDSAEYGPVEVAHQSLLHYFTDRLCV